MDVDQLLERGIQPDFGQNPAPGPLPGPNLVTSAVYHVVHEERPPAVSSRQLARYIRAGVTISRQAARRTRYM